MSVRTGNEAKTMTDRQARWHGRLNWLSWESTEPVILDEEMISQWLRDHRPEYNNATETVKACLGNFRLHRRHRKIVWDIYTRTDFSRAYQKADIQPCQV